MRKKNDQVTIIAKKAKSKGKGKSPQLWKNYEIKDGKAVLKNRKCPKCKMLLATMKNRVYCGGCGYTEIKKS
ncbi:MAG: 30S ribosomal protein S27ae [archaeon]